MPAFIVCPSEIEVLPRHSALGMWAPCRVQFRCVQFQRQVKGKVPDGKTLGVEGGGQGGRGDPDYVENQTWEFRRQGEAVVLFLHKFPRTALVCPTIPSW